jgi:hypothetical protein
LRRCVFLRLRLSLGRSFRVVAWLPVDALNLTDNAESVKPFFLPFRVDLSIGRSEGRIQVKTNHFEGVERISNTASCAPRWCAWVPAWRGCMSVRRVNVQRPGEGRGRLMRKRCRGIGVLHAWIPALRLDPCKPVKTWHFPLCVITNVYKKHYIPMA